MSNFELNSFPDDRALAQTVARRFLDPLESGNNQESRFHLALAGGRIARRLFAELVPLLKARRDLLNRIHFYWGDERCVPPDDPESNFGIARELLLEPLNVEPTHVHRIAGEKDPVLAAREAEQELRQFTEASIPSEQPVLDLIFLGMGEDGHIASLFPMEPDSFTRAPDVYRPVLASKPPPRRITLGYPAIVAAKHVWVLASGPGKEEALRQSLRGRSTPLSHVLHSRSATRIFTDIRI